MAQPVDSDRQLNLAVSKSSFFRAHPRLYVALYHEREAARMAQHSLKFKYIIVPMASALRDDDDIGIQKKYIVPSSLIDIYQFDKITNQIARRNADHKLVFSAGCSVEGQIKVVFLIGCHMIMSHSLNAGQTYDVFRRFEEFFFHLDGGQVNVYDCWRALHRSTCLGWTDFRERFDTECDKDQAIDMEEFIHYSRSAAYVKPCQPSFLVTFSTHTLLQN